MQHADGAAAIAEHDELFAEDARAERPLLDLAQIGDRLPEPAQILAARRATGRLRDLAVGHAVEFGPIAGIGERFAFGMIHRSPPQRAFPTIYSRIGSASIVRSRAGR